MQDIINILVNESIIDFPREELNPDVWLHTDDNYTLIGDAKNKIYETLAKYPEGNIADIAKDIHITGSIGTNQWEDDTDIDVHIIPKEGAIHGDPEEYQKKVFKWFNENRDDIDGYIEQHPIEVYIQLNEAQEYLSDALYSITNDEWLKGPLEEPLDFDPYEEFSGIMDDVAEEGKKADIELGELRRDLIDYEYIKKAIGNLPEENKQNLLIKFKIKLQELETDVENLLKLKKQWGDARKAASAPTTIKQAEEDIEMSKAWRDRNATFKMINRYDYMRLVSDLEDIVGEDKKLTDEEADLIGNMF